MGRAGLQGSVQWLFQEVGRVLGPLENISNLNFIKTLKIGT